MFSYFGSKSRIIKYYPKPIYDIIIEPFAGSAQYAFHYWDKQVILIEKEKNIYDVWNWLINEATPDFIMSLPLFEQSEKIYHNNLFAQTLMRLEAHGGDQGCALSAGKGGFNRWSEKNGRGRKRIADNLYKIKHWKIIYGDYTLAPNIKATWFIDPPYYNKAGLLYKHNCLQIDYKELGQWCKNRLGQVIVCEELGATWLPFKYLVEGRGQKTGMQRNECYIEGIWTNLL